MRSYLDNGFVAIAISAIVTAKHSAVTGLTEAVDSFVTLAGRVAAERWQNAPVESLESLRASNSSLVQRLRQPPFESGRPHQY
jgi:hypothetical protein